MTDPDDPLRGLDPYPRERIEGLHQERAQLLEEIVSTPGPGKQPASTRSKVLLAVGVAAALVIVGGGGWLLGNAESDDGSGDRLTAAGSTSTSTSSSPSSPESPSSSAPTAPSSTATPATPRHPKGVKVLRDGHRCNRLKGASLERVLRLQSRHARGLDSGHARYYLVLRKDRCVVQVGGLHHR
jgi:hypothetical protein